MIVEYCSLQIGLVKGVIDMKETKLVFTARTVNSRNTDGAGLEYNSMGGCWCLAATAFYMDLTGERKYLEDVLKSEQHYYDKFVSVAECYGGPLDTDKAVDSEGILAYIRAVRALHEITGDDRLLQHLRDAIHYECSF